MSNTPTEMIFKVRQNDSNVEICTTDIDGNIVFKKIPNSHLKSCIDSFCSVEKTTDDKNMTILDSQIIAINASYVVIKQPGKSKIITYISPSSNNEIKTYKINFPNAIYIINFSKTAGDSKKIRSIEAYAYKEYKKEKTELFEYPMPNELYGNHMCMGTAPSEIKNDRFVKALERVIFTPYSHSTFSGVKGFTSTEKWFDHLSKSEFPYKLLKPLNRTLGKALK